jgi:hypothetical protein
LFLFIEALQGVHRARREHQEIRRNLSVRNPLDLSYRNPLDARSAREFEAYTRQSSRGITLQRSVIETQKNPSPRKKRRPSLRRLRKSSKSEASKSSGGRTSSSIGSRWRIPWIVRFEVGAQALTLRRSRRGDLEDLNGRWRVLEEKRRNPASHWIRWSCEEVSGEGFLTSKAQEG